MTLHLISVIINAREMEMHSTKEAAQILGLSQDHVRLLARKGIIKAKRLGHDWVILELDYQRKRKPKEKRK